MARILIVDDDPLVRDLVRATLAFGGHELVEAVDGNAALARLADEPDVVVLDMDLPVGPSGLEVLHAARGRELRARFVVLTGSVRDLAEATRGAGATAYLKKPFSPLELITRIEAALAAS